MAVKAAGITGPIPKTMPTASPEKQGRGVQFWALWEPCVPRHCSPGCPRRRPCSEASPYFAPRHPGAGALHWGHPLQPSSLPLPRWVALGYPCPRPLTSILRSAQWVEVCKAGKSPQYLERWLPPHTLQEYRVRSNYSDFHRGS